RATGPPRRSPSLARTCDESSQDPGSADAHLATTPPAGRTRKHRPRSGWSCYQSRRSWTRAWLFSRTDIEGSKLKRLRVGMLAGLLLVASCKGREVPAVADSGAAPDTTPDWMLDASSLGKFRTGVTLAQFNAEL